MPTNKKASVRESLSKKRSNVGGTSLSKKTTLFSRRNGLIVVGLAAIVGLAFVALSRASGPMPASQNLPKYASIRSYTCASGYARVATFVDVAHSKGIKVSCEKKIWGKTYRRYANNVQCLGPSAYRVKSASYWKWCER